MNTPDAGRAPAEPATEDGMTDRDRWDDEIIVTVRMGLDETVRWWLQRPQSDWQIAQIAQDLEDHLITLIEGQRKEDNQ